jgi:hypothetical protein
VFKKLAIVFLPLMLFSGCLNYIQDVQLYPDGSGEMVIQYWMKLPDAESLRVLNKIGIFDKDAIQKEFSSPFVKIQNISVYTDSTDSTQHVKIRLSFINIDSLNNMKVFSEYKFSLGDGAAGQKIFTQFIPPFATGFGIEGGNYFVTYKYTFYGEIISSNAEKQNDRTLTWSYNLSQIGRGKTINVTFRPFRLKETPKWIYYTAGFVLLIVVFFLFRKK